MKTVGLQKVLIERQLSANTSTLSVQFDVGHVNTSFDDWHIPDINRLRSETSSTLSSEQILYAHEIIKDFIASCTYDKGLDPSLFSQFSTRWDVESFRQNLIRHEITKKIPLESALRVIDELYIISPVMES